MVLICNHKILPLHIASMPQLANTFRWPVVRSVISSVLEDVTRWVALQVPERMYHIVVGAVRGRKTLRCRQSFGQGTSCRLSMRVGEWSQNVGEVEKHNLQYVAPH